MTTTKAAKPEPKFSTVKHTAADLGVSLWGLYRDIKRGAFPPAVRIGSRIRISTELLDEFIRAGGTPLGHQNPATTALHYTNVDAKSAALPSPPELLPSA